MGSGRHALPFQDGTSAYGHGRSRRASNRARGRRRFVFVHLVSRRPVDRFRTHRRRPRTTGKDETCGGGDYDTAYESRSGQGLQFHASVVSLGSLDRLPIGGRDFVNLAGRRFGSQPDRTQAVGFRVFERWRPALWHLPEHHRPGRAVAALLDRCEDRRGEDARADRSARFGQQHRGLQSKSRWQALPYVHREVAVRYLDGRRLGPAAENLARSIVASVTGNLRRGAEPATPTVETGLGEASIQDSGPMVGHPEVGTYRGPALIRW